MKKKLIILAGSLMALAIGATTYFSVNSDTEMSLLMQNVEALARDEGIDGSWIVTIYSSTHWKCNSGGGVCCPGYDC